MNIKYWKRFESSGKIEDYLSFVSCKERDEEQGSAAACTKREKEGQGHGKRDKPSQGTGCW